MSSLKTGAVAFEVKDLGLNPFRLNKELNSHLWYEGCKHHAVVQDLMFCIILDDSIIMFCKKVAETLFFHAKL